MFRTLLIITLLAAARPVHAQSDTVSIKETVIDSTLMISGNTREQGKVIIRWSPGSLEEVEYFSIERSVNERGFEVVGLIKHLPGKPWTEWVDEAPAAGRNVYRVRIVNNEPVIRYTMAVTAVLAGEVSFKFYPNPVDNMLIMRSTAPYEVQIIDANGQMRLPLIKLNGLQTVNVSALEKGIYFLRIQNKITNLVTQERIVKN